MLIILKFIMTTYLVHCFILGPLNNAWTVNSKHSIGICGRKEAEITQSREYESFYMAVQTCLLWLESFPVVWIH